MKYEMHRYSPFCEAARVPLILMCKEVCVGLDCDLCVRKYSWRCPSPSPQRNRKDIRNYSNNNNEGNKTPSKDIPDYIGPAMNGLGYSTGGN